jgi:hypothetical protein
MENDTWYPNTNMWMSTSINTGANTISGIIGGSTMTGFTEPTLVLDNTTFIPMLRGTSCKRLAVSAVVLKEDLLLAKIIAPFAVSINCGLINNSYKYEFAEGQLAALMEEYFFFKEEECTS